MKFSDRIRSLLTSRATANIRYLGDVQRLHLMPGDSIVLKTPQPISAETANRLRTELQRELAGRHCIVLGDDLEIGAIGTGAFRPTTLAAHDVLAERNRQVEEEGCTPEFDDAKYTTPMLAQAAGCYCLFADSYPNAGEPPPLWPSAVHWWKPKDYRRDIVRAAALLVAEIERVDRAAARELAPNDSSPKE